LAKIDNDGEGQCLFGLASYAGDLWMLEWLSRRFPEILKQPSTEEEVLGFAVEKGRPEVLAWAVKKGMKLCEHMIHSAARHHQPAALEWLLRNGCPLEKALDWDFMGDLQTMKTVYQHELFNLDELSLCAAIAHDNMDVMHWMLHQMRRAIPPSHRYYELALGYRNSALARMQLLELYGLKPNNSNVWLAAAASGISGEPLEGCSSARPAWTPPCVCRQPSPASGKAYVGFARTAVRGILSWFCSPRSSTCLSLRVGTGHSMIRTRRGWRTTVRAASSSSRNSRGCGAACSSLICLMLSICPPLLTECFAINNGNKRSSQHHACLGISLGRLADSGSVNAGRDDVESKVKPLV
jgi:hypothetical protein